MALVTLATIEYSVRRSRRSTRPILLKRGDITLHPNATEIDANSEYLPLQEAATLAYEQSKGSFVANHAEYNSELNDVIIWFCWALWKRIRIFVSKQPSRIIEEIYYRYKNRYDFTFQGEVLILKQTMKHNYFNNLQVLSSELPEAISQIRSLGDNE